MIDQNENEEELTSTLSERNLSKADPLIEAIGSIDEACAMLGVVVSDDKEFQLKEILTECQKHLSQIMSEISGYADASGKVFDGDQLKWLEAEIEELRVEVLIPQKFIISFKKPISARLNLTRAVVRRAERRVVAVFQKGRLKNSAILHYLNKLSTLLYLLQMKTELA
jgi:cob(I)alamin adenosyltransferase